MKKNIQKIEKRPTKRQIQEANFWINYYFPLWGVGCPLDMDIATTEWTPGYGVGNGMNTEAAWTDEGLVMSLISESDPDVITWVWNNKRDDIERAYPGRPMKLVEEDGVPMKLSVKVLDTTMTEVIRSKPDEKASFADEELMHERNFADLMEEILEDYKAPPSCSPEIGMTSGADM